MAALEKVLELQSQGMQDTEIIRKLRDEGISPQEINDSLNQLKIKNAVSQPGIADSEMHEMEQSIMQETQPQEAQPQAQPAYAEQYPSQDYAYQDQYTQPQAADTETISEIAEQVVSEKFKQFAEKTGDISSFKSNTQDRLAEIEAKIKRIENSLDKIQQAIIGKIGEYGENMSLVQRDLENMHNTMSKLMNPLIDNYNQMKKIAR